MKKLKLNINVFQNLGTILALVISALALFVSIYEANIMRDQQKALVWPYLMVNSSYSGNGFSFVAVNNGTGPALVKSMEVLYKGKPMSSYNQLLNEIKPDRVIGYDRLRMSDLNGTVIRPGETRQIFNMPWDDETRQMVDSMQYVKVTVQFCSVLEECWFYNSIDKEVIKGEFKSELEFGDN